MGLYYWRETDKNLYLYLVGLVIALGIQVHLLVGVHILTVFLFCFLKSRTKKFFFSIVLFLFLACFPVLLYNMLDFLHILETSAFNPINHLLLLKSHLFSEKWIKYVTRTFSVYYTIPLLLMLLLLTFYRKKQTKRWLITKSTGDLFIIIAIPCFFGILIARHSWYLYFISVFLILFFSKWYDDLMPDNSDKKLNYLFICGFAATFPLLLSDHVTDFLSSKNLLYVMEIHYVILLPVLLLLFFVINTKWTYRHLRKTSVLFIFFLLIGQMQASKVLWPWNRPIQKSFSRTVPKYRQLYPLMEQIYLETNWLPKEAIRRMHIIGINTETSLLSHYSMAREAIRKRKHNGYLKEAHLSLRKSFKKPQGYMIIQHLKQFTDYSKTDWEKYLTQSSLLSDFLREEIVEGKTLIRTSKFYDYYWLIPYNTTRESVFKEGFNNLGQPYYWEEPEWLKNCSFTQKFQNQSGFYYCMILSGHLQKAGVHIKFSENNRQISRYSHLDISFVGPLIGSSECCGNLDGSAIWFDVQMSLLCGKVYYRYDMPGIGNNWRETRKAPDLQGQYFVAPLKLQIPVNGFTRSSGKASALWVAGCKNQKDIKEIELTFNNLYNNQQPPQKIKVVWKEFNFIK